MSERTNPISSNHEAASRSSAPLRPGDSIDKFQLIEVIATGGTAIVWKGYDKLLDRSVAIKQLRPSEDDAADAALRDRFAAEVELYKKLAQNNKHLVRLLQYIDDPRGPFIVMEHVEGQTLEQLLAAEGKPLEVTQALGIVAGVALGLKTLHSHDVLHRDLKPANIILPRDGGLKICDFGLATIVGEQQALSTGSVRYMAPELFHDEAIDAKSDIYSLGIIAYEMLAGRSGFNDAFKAVLRDQRNQSLRWMKWHTNPRATAPPLKQFNPAVSDTLSELIERMMHKDVAMRIGSAEELLGAIRRHFAGGQEPAQAPRPSVPAESAPGDPTAPLPKRSRLPYILAAILLVQALVALGIWGLASSRQNRELRQQRQQARQAYDSAMSHYQAGRFDQARSAFQQVLDDWSTVDASLAGGSRARMLLIEGRQQLEAGDAAAALALFNQVQDMRLLNADEVAALVREASTRSSFASEVRAIEQHLEQGQIGEARRRLRDQRSYTHTPDEEKILSELGARIEDQINQREIARVSQDVERLIREGKRAEAIARLNEAVARYSGSGNFRQRLDELNRAARYEQLLLDAQNHEAAGRLAQAVQSLNSAQQIKSDAQVEQRMNRLRAAMAYQEGAEHERTGNLAAAHAAYTRALGYGEHAQASAAINRLKVADQRVSFVRAGDEAAAAGEYDAAAKHYQNALKLGPDDEVSGKLRQMNTQAGVQRVRRLIDEPDFAAAGKALEPLLASAADDAQVREVRDLLEQRQSYSRHLAAGDELRGKSRFGEAKREYLRARKIIDTAEVRQRLNEAEYDHLIAQARDYMDAQKWSSARAVLRAAAQTSNTPLVQELLAKVNQEAPIDEEELRR